MFRVLHPLGLIFFAFVAGCSAEAERVGSPEILGQHSQSAYELIELADKNDKNELSRRLVGVKYYYWVEGDQRPEGRLALSEDVFGSVEGSCTIDKFTEYESYRVTAEWSCDAYDIEMSMKFSFGPDGKLIAIEREIPRWVTEV